MVRSELAEMGWSDSTFCEMLRMFSKRLTCRGRLKNYPRQKHKEGLKIWMPLDSSAWGYSCLGEPCWVVRSCWRNVKGGGECDQPVAALCTQGREKRPCVDKWELRLSEA